MNAAQQAATAFLLPSLCFCFITKKLITVEIPLFFQTYFERKLILFKFYLKFMSLHCLVFT